MRLLKYFEPIVNLLQSKMGINNKIEKRSTNPSPKNKNMNNKYT